MAITLTPAINGSGVVDAAGNTYAVLADWDTFFESRLNASVATGALEDDQKRALISAMVFLESLNYLGVRLTTTQSLAFPRVGNTPETRNTSRRYRTGFETLTAASGGFYDRSGKFWASTAIPAPLIKAQCEVGMALLQDSDWNESDGITRIRTGVVTAELKGDTFLSKFNKIIALHLGAMIEGSGITRIARA
jgi:hypothetical protein